MPGTHPLPAGVRVHTMAEQDQIWSAAANHDVFAWAADGVLRVVDRRDWHDATTLKPRLPAKSPLTVTAGNRLIAYSTKERSVIYDTRAHATVVWPGPVFAAGDWLLWQSAAGYRLGKLN